jgi:glycosyltransferase involved in cell wall biosynthesis|tara:strand:+ start:857 stop:1774 length:918 start_codon:yes stop_codon:yes gene_type:complete
MYSIIIPVFNSENIVGRTIDKTVSFCRDIKINFEIILINDGSSDNSWSILIKKARQYEEVKVINLLQNYGQHIANFCGFRYASGDYVITMDDDLQNPPEEISKLIEKAADGYDLVIGQFKEKRHSVSRRLGSKLVGVINRKIFNSPRGLVLTNFRLIRKDVIERVCSYKASYPYIPGLVVKFSSNRANVLVEHHKREMGESNYSLLRITKLVSEILFNYSSYPLRLVAGLGLMMSVFSFLLSLFYLTSTLVDGTSVPGWATVVVLLSFFNGMTLFVIGMVGEYLVRLINQSSASDMYHIKEIIGV